LADTRRQRKEGDYGIEINNAEANKRGVLGQVQSGATTQKGGILLATSKLNKYQMTLPGGKKKEIVRENPMSIEDIGHVVAHELLHTARLDHPWIEKLVKDIAQKENGKRSAVPDETIKNNLMNSPENPLPALQPKDHENKDVTPGQVNYVKKVVEAETKSKTNQ